MVADSQIEQAARAVASADALLIAAGAGMGVDSGLPDFRGDQGFWRAYPPYQKLGLRFTALANPHWFASDPELAWGFYGHRLNLYRATQPHDGFRILLSWAQRMRHGAFVFTSNVDGQFQRAGFDLEQILEVHGSIDWMQCTGNCGPDCLQPMRSWSRWMRRPCAPANRCRPVLRAGRWRGPTSSYSIRLWRDRNQP
jgi:NAD-dependent SIR2 family protein deacetylase